MAPSSSCVIVVITVVGAAFFVAIVVVDAVVVDYKVIVYVYRDATTVLVNRDGDIVAACRRDVVRRIAVVTVVVRSDGRKGAVAVEVGVPVGWEGLVVGAVIIEKGDEEEEN